MEIGDLKHRIILQKFTTLVNENGFEAYVVGGCVRDSLLGREPGDWDITTSAKPEEVKDIFKRTIDTGIQHGTVTVMIDHEGYEVTTYRIDGEYEDGRHPKNVEFTSNLLEDLKRRDFTINAMAYSSSQGLVDAFGGKMDLDQGIIRCVGRSVDRFTEDALRILRAIRFAGQLGFSIDDETMDAISVIAPNMAKVSKERIQVELTKLLLSGYPEKINLVYEKGIAPYIGECWEKAGRYGLDHMELIKNLPESKHMRWAGFLRRGSSAEAESVLKELKMDNDTIYRVKSLVSEWKEDITGDKPSIRRIMSRLEPSLFDDLLIIKEVFYREYPDTDLGQVQKLAEEIRAAGDCISLKSLAVTGQDLLAAGMKPGPKLGEVLGHMLEIVLEFPEFNTREYLLKECGLL